MCYNMDMKTDAKGNSDKRNDAAQTDGGRSRRCHHCGFEKRHPHVGKQGKRIGAVGAALIVLHLLYHVAEILILPAALVALGGPQATHHAESAAAMSLDEEQEAEDRDEAGATRAFMTWLYTDFFETLD